MITIRNLHLHFGDAEILRGVNFSVQEGECIAVVGPNGCGKSTLLRVIGGVEHADSGEVKMPNRYTVGYLPQEADLDTDRTVEEELLDAFVEAQQAMEEMTELEHDLAETDPTSDDYEQLMTRYGRCSHLVEHHQGYTLEAETRRVGMGLGFSLSDLGRSCREYSGGWQMRILLAKLLLRMPDVLLLDEPTNHLDLETTLWLEGWIKECGRTVIMVSHERATMDRLANRIICMSQGTAEIYPGDYSKYLEQSQAKRDAQWAAFERQQKEIEGHEHFIRRFRATASRATLVQSRIKMLSKIERIVPPFHPTAIHFKFPKAPASHTDVLTLEKVAKVYDDLCVFSDVNLTIRRGEKIGLVGLNGAGKSTLLRLLAGREEPSEGTCKIGGNVTMSYFAQYDTSSLSSNTSMFEALRASAPVGEAPRVRDLLGAFLFKGDDVDKPLNVLSGGERTRFRLAQMLFSPANLLLLDEPTNHLDITSRATVEEALRDYAGTVIVVSHDRVFMERVTDRIIEISNGGIYVYPGSYGDYLIHKEQMAAEAKESGSGGKTSGPVLSGSNSGQSSRQAAPSDKEDRMRNRKERKALSRQISAAERRVKKCEADIETTEAEIGALDIKMSNPETAADFGKLSPLIESRKSATERLECLLMEWEQCQEEADRLKEDLE